MATDFVKKNGKTLHFCRSGIQKRNGISLPQCVYERHKDASISCENFVKFGPVIPELTEHICKRQVPHGQKN